MAAMTSHANDVLVNPPGLVSIAVNKRDIYLLIQPAALEKDAQVETEVTLIPEYIISTRKNVKECTRRIVRNV